MGYPCHNSDNLWPNLLDFEEDFAGLRPENSLLISPHLRNKIALDVINPYFHFQDDRGFKLFSIQDSSIYNGPKLQFLQPYFFRLQNSDPLRPTFSLFLQNCYGARGFEYLVEVHLTRNLKNEFIFMKLLAHPLRT